jgi:hypothetical protein
MRTSIATACESRFHVQHILPCPSTIQKAGVNSIRNSKADDRSVTERSHPWCTGLGPLGGFHQIHLRPVSILIDCTHVIGIDAITHMPVTIMSKAEIQCILLIVRASYILQICASLCSTPISSAQSVDQILCIKKLTLGYCYWFVSFVSHEGEDEAYIGIWMSLTR